MTTPTEQASPKRPTTVTAASMIIMTEAALGVCQLLGLAFLTLVAPRSFDPPDPDNMHARERDLAIFFAVIAVLIVFAALAEIAKDRAAWARIGVWALSCAFVAAAVVSQLLTAWAIWPFAVAVVLIAVPNLLLLTPSANAYFRRESRGSSGTKAS